MTSAVSIQAARQRLLDASSVVEALRPSIAQLDVALTGEARDARDQPVLNAWLIARGELRAACAAFVQTAP